MNPKNWTISAGDERRIPVHIEPTKNWEDSQFIDDHSVTTSYSMSYNALRVLSEERTRALEQFDLMSQARNCSVVVLSHWFIDTLLNEYAWSQRRNILTLQGKALDLSPCFAPFGSNKGKLRKLQAIDNLIDTVHYPDQAMRQKFSLYCDVRDLFYHHETHTYARHKAPKTISNLALELRKMGFATDITSHWTDVLLERGIVSFVDNVILDIVNGLGAKFYNSKVYTSFDEYYADKSKYYIMSPFNYRSLYQVVSEICAKFDHDESKVDSVYFNSTRRTFQVALIWDGSAHFFEYRLRDNSIRRFGIRPESNIELPWFQLRPNFLERNALVLKDD